MRPAFLKIALPFLAFLTLLSSTFGDDHPGRNYARSMVVTPYGIVATSYVQASQAGARMLEKGGSAIDAGIAANAVLGVGEPMTNGIGGDLFAIYWDAKTGKLYGLNASGWAPKGLTIEHLRAKGVTSMPQAGIDAVTVPGAVDGWSKLHGRFGKLPWAQLFEPAIFYARNGYAVPEIIHGYWEDAVDWISHDTESQRVFLPGGKAPATGEIFRNPDLANTLTLLAKGGPSAYYKGEIAQAILKTSAEVGGTMTADDLARILRRVGGAHLDDLSRLEGVRTAPERRRNGRAGDAEHHGTIAAGAGWSGQCGRVAHAHRGDEAGLCGYQGL